MPSEHIHVYVNFVPNFQNKMGKVIYSQNSRVKPWVIKKKKKEKKVVFFVPSVVLSSKE